MPWRCGAGRAPNGGCERDREPIVTTATTVTDGLPALARDLQAGEPRIVRDPYRELVERAAVGSYGADLDGRVRAANAALCSMIGYSEGELREKTIFELVDGVQADRVHQIAQRMLAGAPADTDRARARRRGRSQGRRRGLMVAGRAGRPPRSLRGSRARRKRTEGARAGASRAGRCTTA